MIKTKLTLAMAGMLALPPALCAQSNATIYGRFTVDFENVKADGATTAGPLPPVQVGVVPTGVNRPSRSRVTSNSSNIGFKGTEDLGNGLKAFFQLESRVDLDVGGSTFATRNSGVGLASNWGSALLGIWDTPYLLNNIKIDPFYFVLIASPRSLISNPGFGTGSVTRSGRDGTSADASFDRRQGNSLQYWTPPFADFSAWLAYSASEDKSADNAVPEINPYIWSGSIAYDRGPLYINIAHEHHIDYFGLTGMGVGGTLAAANDSSHDKGTKISVGYTFGNTTLGAIWERLEYENDDDRVGNVDEYERDAWSLALFHRIGSGTIRASYTKAKDADCSRVGGSPCSAGETGADQCSVGYSHSLSKRTDLYVFYTVLDNDEFATYQFGVGGALPHSAGTKGRGIGLGINHTF